MGNREEQRLRHALRDTANAFNIHEEPSDDETLHVRPKPRSKKRKPKVVQQK